MESFFFVDYFLQHADTIDVFTGKNSRVVLLFTLFCTAALLYVTDEVKGIERDGVEKISVFRRAVNKTIMSPLSEGVDLDIDFQNVDGSRRYAKAEESSEKTLAKVDLSTETEAVEEELAFVPSESETKLLESLLHSEIQHSTYRTELLLKVLDNELRRVELEVQSLIPPEYESTSNQPQLKRIVVERSENGKVKFGEESKVTTLNYPAKIYISKAGRISRAIGKASIVLHAKEGGSKVRGVVVVSIGDEKKKESAENQLDFLVDDDGTPHLVFSQEFELSSEVVTE